ncbi:hypothetical protein DXG01_015305 [Tephrocybe rancida]|nr:hypothetical protein DXG01_015305 [Tephrocybe rancida]
MDDSHDEGHWPEHAVGPSSGAPQLSASVRSTRPRRDSHSRRHHREREGGRGSTKSKNPSHGHRSTRYKEKFHALRDKYDRVLSIRDSIEREYFIAAEKREKIQAENDLLLDAIYTAAPELMQLVSPSIPARPLPSPHITRGPHPQEPTQRPPPPHPRLSPRQSHSPSMSRNHSHNHNQNHNPDRQEQEQEHETSSIPQAVQVRESPRHGHARVPSPSSVQTATNGNIPSAPAHANGTANGVARATETESVSEEKEEETS